jgi:hypothetical protein
MPAARMPPAAPTMPPAPRVAAAAPRPGARGGERAGGPGPAARTRGARASCRGPRSAGAATRPGRARPRLASRRPRLASRRPRPEARQRERRQRGNRQWPRHRQWSGPGQGKAGQRCSLCPHGCVRRGSTPNQPGDQAYGRGALGTSQPNPSPPSAGCRVAWHQLGLLADQMLSPSRNVASRRAAQAPTRRTYEAGFTGLER